MAPLRPRYVCNYGFFFYQCFRNSITLTISIIINHLTTEDSQFLGPRTTTQNTVHRHYLVSNCFLKDKGELWPHSISKHISYITAKCSSLFATDSKSPMLTGESGDCENTTCYHASWSNPTKAARSIPCGEANSWLPTIR